ncbi:hypothetical protein HC028_02925 [Planosporangium flavigriseum]|nr:hypothetical protein [Planosporangium flavigriseum]
MDGRTAGNLQWLSFPPGVRHVFCYAYYVKGAEDSGTVMVRMRATRPVGFPQQVRFAGGLSFTADGAFTLASSGDQVEAAFTRAPAGYRIQPAVPAGWRLAGAACTASRADGRPERSRSTVDAATGATAVTLAADDIVVCTYSMEPPAAQPGLRLSVLSPGAGGTFGLTVAGGAGQPALTATTGDNGTAVAASGADLTTLAPGRYTVTVAPPAGPWTLTGVLCNGAPASVTALTFTIDLASGAPLECVLGLARKPPALRLHTVTTGGVATAAFAVASLDGAGAGWWAAASTTGYGVPEPATGDVPRDLPFGTYLVTAIPPRSTRTTGWRLTALRCDQGTAMAGTTVRVALTPGGPDPVCTATYQADPTTRFGVTLQAKGSTSGRKGPAVVEVSCADGSGGRLVLAPDATGPVALPEPLAFLESTSCRIEQTATGAAGTSTVTVSAVRRPSTGDRPLELPAELTVARDVAEYTVAVTAEFGEPTATAARASILDEMSTVPVILAAIGVFGFGTLVLLGVFLRRRAM